MTPHDQMRLGQLISDFIARCEVEPPLYLFAIGSNGTVIVSRHTASGNEQVCASPGALLSPVLLTVVGMDGKGASCKVEIEAARATMQ